MAEAIRAHHAAGKLLLAECGGMLYLLDCLEDADGERGELLGLLPGRARLQKRLTALALQEVELPEGRLRGHTFHHSTLDCAVEPLARGVCPNGRNTAGGGVPSWPADGFLYPFLPAFQPAGRRRAGARARRRLTCPDSSHAFSATERAAVYRAIAERRDMRHFSGGSVAPELLALLEAAHQAPASA